jgi:myo-inositol-1(or 4)-monophosphatase
MEASQEYDISDADLSEIYAFAIQLGKDAGAILLDTVQKRRRDTVDGENQDQNDATVEAPVMEEKLNAVDIVTKTDTGTSILIVDWTGCCLKGD